MFCRVGHLILIVSLICCQIAVAQEWTRYRGPNGTGESETVMPANWTDADYAWVADLPGIGHASPVIWADKVFVQSADSDGTQWVLCLNAKDGSQVWAKSFQSHPYHIHARNSFASSTPSVSKDAVYVAFATPEQITLLALSHSGELIWKREDLGGYASQHGFASSPVLFGDTLVLTSLQQSKDGTPTGSSVMAFDRSTGADLWSTPRVSGKASYSVPCLHATDAGDELVLCSTTHGMFGLDLSTGKETWSVPQAFSMRTVSSPLIKGNLAFGSTGSGGGGNYVVAVDLLTKKEKYRVTKQAPYVPTPVAFGDLVFLWYDKGVVRCMSASTGETVWRERVGGNYSGSPVRIGDKVYCIAEDGTVVVLAASKEFQMLGKTELGEDSRSTPAVSGGRMFLRTYSKVFCLAAGKST